MDFEKIPEERLFQNNTKEEIKHWCKNLRYFHYMRGRSGHNCEGDAFSVYFRYKDIEDLTNKLSQIGITLTELEAGFIAFDPFESYSFEDLDKIKKIVPGTYNVEQPQSVYIFGYKSHVWVSPSRFEISISGSGNGNTYKVSSEDFKVCIDIENHFDKLGWDKIVDENIKSYAHCISEKIYPELY